MGSRIAFVLAAMLVACTSTEAQEVSLQDLSLGLSFGYVSSPPPRFSDAICRDEHPTSLRAHGALRIARILFVSLGVARNTENPDLCVNGLIPPVPDKGPWTYESRAVAPGVTGYPFTTTDLQVGVRGEGPGASVRAGIGPVWFHGKGIVGTTAAAVATIRLGSTPFAVMVGFDQTWLSVPYTDIRVSYLDGRIEDVQLTLGHARERARTVRVGVEVRR